MQINLIDDLRESKQLQNNRVIINREKILLKLDDTECNKNRRNRRVTKIQKFYFK